MAQTDWTLIDGGGNGSTTTVIDATSPGTGTQVLRITGKQSFASIPAGNVLNGQIEAWCLPVNGGGGSVAVFGLRAQDDTVTASQYLITINAYGLNPMQVIIYRTVAGVTTTILGDSTTMIPPAGKSSNSWHKWRAGVITSGSQVILRMELWNHNTSTYDKVINVIDSSASRITTAGKLRFGGHLLNGQNMQFEDVKVYSLA